MDKFCVNCGNELKPEDKFCGGCGAPVPGADMQVQAPDVPQDANKKNRELTPEEKKEADKLTIVSLLLGLIGPAIEYVLLLVGVDSKSIQSLVGLFPIAALALLIYVRVKYPKHLFSKVLFIIYIIGLVISVVLIIAFMMACAIACNELVRSS